MERERSKQERGPREHEAYGVAGLTQNLHGISFPISKREILERWGHQKFQWTKEGLTMTLRDCLQNLPDEVRSITQITHSISEAIK